MVYNAFPLESFMPQKSSKSTKIALALLLIFLCVFVANAAWQNPKTAEEFNNRGLDRQSNGDLDGAIADYTRALEFEPNDPAIYYGRGVARRKKNDLEGALADYSKTIELDQRHALAYAHRGVVKVLLKHPDAGADFEAAFRLDPSLKATYNEFYEKRRKP